MNVCRPEVVINQIGLDKRIQLICRTHGFVSDHTDHAYGDEKGRAPVYLMLRRWQDHCLMHANEKEMITEPGIVIQTDDSLPVHLR